MTQRGGTERNVEVGAAAQRDTSELKLESVFRATPIGITFNVARSIHTVNDFMCEITGYSEQELIGSSARILYHSEAEFERVGALLYEPLKHQGRTTVEATFRRKDGCSIAVVLNAGLVDRQDTNLGYVVTVQDVTAQRRAEDALRTSEERFRSIVEQSPFSIQVFAANGEVVVVNDAFCSLWGTAREALTGYNILKDPRLEALGLLPSLHQAFRGETVRTPVLPYEVPTGAGNHRRVVQSAFYPLKDAAGELQNVVMVQLDFTDQARAEEERNRLQEQLQQAMKMEAIGRLAGGVAHDFNNLLTAIGGNTELAIMDIGNQRPVADYLAEVSKAAESAASLTRQLLAFSRRQLIEPRVLNLNDIVERLNKMLRRVIGDDVALSASLSQELGAVRVDPGQFEQVLVNLAVNARDAMPNGGRLIVETSNIDLEADYCALHPQTRPGRYVMLSVSDTGEGMTPAVQQRLFEPFFTTKAVGKGTGLGLATIFGIVKQAGGAVEVYSELGLGTTFKIYIPRVEERPEELESASPPVRPIGGTETILLAEDNESVLGFARTLLEKLGYMVLLASSGTFALEIAQGYRGPIHLLITDVVMPGMNGRELASQIAICHPETKVLFTSGYAEDVIVHHGVLQKNLEFIGKPYSLTSLSAKVRSILDRGGFGSQR